MDICNLNYWKQLFSLISLKDPFFTVDLGLVIATTGLFIAIVSFLYSKPKVQIYKAKLYVNNLFFTHDVTSIEEIYTRNNDWQVDFYAEIFVRNSKGGPGSITKPTLNISVKDKFFRYKTLENIEPIIEHEESEVVNTNTTQYWSVREGASLTLPPNSYLDDMIIYSKRFTNNPKDLGVLKVLANENSEVRYQLVYYDSNGKKKVHNIQQIHNERERSIY